MNPTTRDSLSLLKLLDARGVQTASEHFASPRPRRSAPPLEELIPSAERVTTAAGSCYRVTTTCGLSSERSREGFLCPVSEFEVANPGRAFAALTRDPRFADLDPRRIAFIDTEATSLSNGSGTCAFLIGVGRFIESGFIVRQYFMADYTEEEAMIDLVTEDLADAEAVASYNGKCFDIPLMASRWLMQRRRPKFPELHLDLLFPSRRLWRGRFADCRLSTIEIEVLGILRVSDIPSSLIPSIYFEFLRGVGCERMARVFDHHAQDIYSLGALAMAHARAWENPEDARFAHAIEQWGLARVLHASGRLEESLAALERAILAARDEEMEYRLSMHLARTLRRMGRDDEAIEIWKARAAAARVDRLDPLIELAKHAEHRLRDFNQAREWTQQALRIVQNQTELAQWISSGSGSRNNSNEIEKSLRARLERIDGRARRSLAPKC